MSSKNLEQVIQRAISDAAFRRQLQSNPDAALRGFKLSDNEVAALRSGDAGKLIGLGIDQRMSKAFTVGGSMAFNAATRASVDGGNLSVGGSALTDSDVSARTVIPESDRTSIGDPLRADPNSASDAVEDQSHAFAATRSADVEGTARSAVRDSEPVDLRGGAVTDEGQLSMGDRIIDPYTSTTVRSAVRDSEPFDVRGTAGDDAGVVTTRVHDTEPVDLRSAATDDAGMVTSRVNDSEPFDLRGAATDDAGMVTTRVHDTEPVDLRSAATDDAGMVTSRVNDSEPFDLRSAATDDASTLTSRVNDSEPFDLRGAESAGGPTSDQLEDMSHSIATSQNASLGAPSADALEDMSHDIASNQDAFLSSDEATKYQTDANWSSDQAEDISHEFNPDATTVPQGTGDAIGDTGTNDPQISA